MKKQGGQAPRRKGTNAEREFVQLMGGERVPLSGSAGGSYTGDVTVPYLGKGEVKRRKQFATLYSWIKDVDFVALRADRQEWLVVLRAKDIKQLVDEFFELKLKGKL